MSNTLDKTGVDKITIEKLPSGNYLILAPDLKPEGVEYEQAYHVVTQVRESLNYLKLPPEPEGQASMT